MKRAQKITKKNIYLTKKKKGKESIDDSDQLTDLPISVPMNGTMI